MTRLLVLAALLTSTSAAVAGPKVGVVVGTDAPKLERFAADELAAQFRQLFDAEVTVSDKVPDGVDHLVLVGTPKTNPAVAKAVGDKWPKLTEQGHVLRSVTLGDRKALVAGGGSPVATLWAAYELGHHFGIRSFLHGDVMPEKVPGLKLDGIDIALEPAVKLRVWQVLDDSPTGFAAWGLDDYKTLFRQLAKLKFTHIVRGFDPKSYPHPERWRAIRVGGDTPGRKAFRGAKEFENPVLAGVKSDDDRRAALGVLAKQLADVAPEFGLALADPTAPEWFSHQARGILPRVGVRTFMNQNFRLVADVPGDLSPAAYYYARRAFNPELTPKEAHTQFFTPILGAPATERVLLGFETLDKANALVAKHDPRSFHVRPDSVAEQFRYADPPPVWWKEAGKLYADAMNEMYRAIRATFNDPARPALLYHAKRCEFAMHHFAALEAARLAGIAKAKGEKEMVVAHLEKAIESTYNALNAYGDVARDPSDRGVIAVLAEDAYRPLTAELKAAEKPK
jgi:hypothetical protein